MAMACRLITLIHCKVMIKNEPLSRKYMVSSLIEIKSKPYLNNVFVIMKSIDLF